jgi:hypothetical protein
MATPWSLCPLCASHCGCGPYRSGRFVRWVTLHELDAANRQLTEYAAQVEDLALSNERPRTARELHDTLSQVLAGLILQLEAVDAHLARQRRSAPVRSRPDRSGGRDQRRGRSLQHGN